ncbi:MAG: efflux RND transporter periplasmic adaptor subunit, partial [Candidatus Omnitrophica bacterium]|nr:efflux RND transporter periplasmic adaptor subunit [Candidatus Omnitrophota bacterium]
MTKTKKFFVFILILIAVAGGLWIFRSGLNLKLMTMGTTKEKALYYCPMHPTYTSDRPGDCPICNMKLVKADTASAQEEDATHAGHSSQAKGELKEFTVQELLNMKSGQICLLHKCKMGDCMIALTEKDVKLGKCPHCGEDLGVIVKDLVALKGYANVKLSTDKAQAIGIKTDLAKKMAIAKTIRTVGRIAYDPELYQAEEEYVQAIQALRKAETGTIPEVKEQASRLVDSAKIKLKLLGLSDDLIKEIEVQGKPDRSLLYSEAGGSVWLYAPIYEYEIPLVKVGDKIQVEIPAIPGKNFQGVIRSIDSVLDSMTRTIRVRAVLDNPEGLLKPEMYANASLQMDLGEVLVIPEESVFQTGEKNIVFVTKDNGVFEPRQVTLGVKSDRFQEIKSGILEGESVVTSGNFLIDSESRLKAALEGAGGAG